MKLGVDVQGVPQTVKALESVREGIHDFRGVTWLRVRQQFFKTEREIFESEGGASRAGKWAALSSPYKEIKQRKYGNKPILQASGKMYREFTGNPAGVEEKADELTLKFSQPAGWHKSGTSRMPKRDPVDLTDAQKDQLLDPVRLRIRQLIDNAKLRDLRGF